MRVEISKIMAMRQKKVPKHYRYFCSIVVEFMQLQRSNVGFHCINICKVYRGLLKTSAFGLGFQQSLGTLQTLMHV